MRDFLPTIIALCCLLITACGPSKELTATQGSLTDCQTELEQAQQRLATVQRQMSDNGGELNRLQSQIATLQQQLSVSQSNLNTVTQQMQASSDDYGVWFRVQIGAYEDRRIDNNLANSDQLGLEQQNGVQKISLGRFRNYEEAKSLQQQLQAMGVKGAWIVTYRDGQRVPIESVQRQ